MSRYPNYTPRMTGRYQKNMDDGFLHLLLFYILPFLVFNGLLFYCVTAKPKISLEIGEINEYLTTEAILKISSPFPTKSISVNLDGEILELDEPKKRTYTIPIYKNGLLEADVTNINGMVGAEFLQINVLDDNPPTIDNALVADGIIKVTVSDGQSGIDFESIHAINSSGQEVIPLAVDRAANTLSYEMDPAGLQISAQDRAGNKVQGTFTSHMEKDVETLEQSSEASAETANNDVQAAE